MEEERNGFEWKGRFYPWSLTDIGKDLMLIERITHLSPSQFLNQLGDIDENANPITLLVLVGTSLRLGHPEWSVDRLYRTVMNLSLSEDITFVGGEEEEEEEQAEEDPTASRRVVAVAAPQPPPSGPGRSPSSVSLPQSARTGS